MKDRGIFDWLGRKRKPVEPVEPVSSWPDNLSTEAKLSEHFRPKKKTTGEIRPIEVNGIYITTRFIKGVVDEDWSRVVTEQALKDPSVIKDLSFDQLMTWGDKKLGRIK